MVDNTQKLIISFILIMFQPILDRSIVNCFLSLVLEPLLIMVFIQNKNSRNSSTIHFKCKKRHSRVHLDLFKDKFLQMTVQPSIVSTKIKRTKFFFGYRYMWTKCQLSEPCSYVGAGVRKDVTSPPAWTNKISD